MLTVDREKKKKTKGSSCLLNFPAIPLNATSCLSYGKALKISHKTDRAS